MQPQNSNYASKNEKNYVIFSLRTKQSENVSKISIFAFVLWQCCWLVCCLEFSDESTAVWSGCVQHPLCCFICLWIAHAVTLRWWYICWSVWMSDTEGATGINREPGTAANRSHTSRGDDSPPPTYSIIERQTSFSSSVCSQTSSMSMSVCFCFCVFVFLLCIYICMYQCDNRNSPLTEKWFR